MYNFSYGVLLNKGLRGIRLIKYVAQRRASPQYCNGNFAWKNKDLAVASRCLCFLSTTPFCCGVLVQLVSCTIPLLRYTCLISPSHSSCALSNLITSTLVEKCNSTYKRNCLITETTSDLYFIKCVQVARVKSSTIVINWLHPECVVTL